MFLKIDFCHSEIISCLIAILMYSNVTSPVTSCPSVVTVPKCPPLFTVTTEIVLIFYLISGVGIFLHGISSSTAINNVGHVNKCKCVKRETYKQYSLGVYIPLDARRGISKMQS